MLGRRISASTSNTFPPFCANTIAVLMLVVVLPSWGNALVTMITLGADPIDDNNIEVRKARYDSATSDFGRACASRLMLVFRRSVCALLVSDIDLVLVLFFVLLIS